METNLQFQKLDTKLNVIRSELDYIKEHMIDRDMILSDEDKKVWIKP